MVRARTGQFAGVAALRSALHSYRTFTTRGRYFIDRCGGVLFPVAFIQSAGYKAFLRVQSERSERLRELTPAARRRCCLNFSVLFQSVLLQPHKIKKQKEKSLNPRNSGINKIVHGRLPAKPEKTSVPDPPQAQKRSLSVFSEFIQRQRPRALPVRSVTYALVFHQPR